MDYDYLDEMYAGIIEKEPEIVYSVSKYAKKFDVKRMKVEQLLPIFIGTYEIMYSRDEIPAKVIVNEAVELAKLFTDDATRKLTNGVLNSILENHLDLVEEASKLEEHKNYFFTKK
jgi:N utilization substance protein B